MIDKIFETGIEVIRKIQKTQSQQLDEAAKIIAEAFLNDNTFYVSGSGHSHTVVEKFYARA